MSKKLSDLTVQTSLAAGDLLEITDVSDTTDSAEGSTKATTIDAIDDHISATTNTLTNKTIAYASNTLTDVAGTTATQTLTNKTITYADNTLTGVAGTTATQTLTNKTLSTGCTVDASASDYFGINPQSRNMLMNGGFNIWQRGASLTLADATSQWLADRWIDLSDKNGGTAPTLSRTKQSITPGDLSRVYYYSRLTTNGAGTSLGVNSYHSYYQRIPNATKFHSNGAKVTLSFYARSDIANKRLGIYLVQNYGTGGSPTAEETINGTNWTLTNSWTKYTHTFTTNTLVGKTFGTGDDDYLYIVFRYMWGSGQAAKVGAADAETYIGAGNIDIAQVQINIGDVALPYEHVSIDTEYNNCARYYYEANVLANANPGIASGLCFSTTQVYVTVPICRYMRSSSPTLGYSNLAIRKSDGSRAAVTALTLSGMGGNAAQMVAEVASGLTAGNGAILVGDNSTSARLNFADPIF